MKVTSTHELTQEQLALAQNRRRTRNGILSLLLLRIQNTQLNGTMGVSGNNRNAGFVPAYLDLDSGRAIISRFADGRPAPVHILDGLPEQWVLQTGSGPHLWHLLAELAPLRGIIELAGPKHAVANRDISACPVARCTGRRATPSETRGPGKCRPRRFWLRAASP
jgi:hypothetical protein